MRALLLVPALTFALVALSGCSQTRSAWNSTQCATQSAWKSTQGAWNKGKAEVNRATAGMRKQRAIQKAPVVEACANQTTRCTPPAAVAQPSECVSWTQPIYPNHCGGDNGIGRGGTGAFKIP